MMGSDAEGPGAAEPRRRYWRQDEKRRIVAESFTAGASVAEVARRNGLNANLLFTWRRRFGAVAEAQDQPAILPVTVTSSPAISFSPPPATPGRMEIVFPGGEKIVVGADVEALALARVIKALRR
jgi:transposase